MKNISFIRASKNIKYYKGNIKGKVQNLYIKNKTLLRDIKELSKLFGMERFNAKKFVIPQFYNLF